MADGSTNSVVIWVTLITALQTLVIEWIRRRASQAGRERMIKGVRDEIRASSIRPGAPPRPGSSSVSRVEVTSPDITPISDQTPTNPKG